MIRLATLEDVKRICATRGDHYDDSVNWQMCVVGRCGKYEMLFCMMRFGAMAEVHVYCPPSHMRGFKQMVGEFYDECRRNGIKELITATDKNKSVDGVVLKIGFELISEQDEMNVYRRIL